VNHILSFAVHPFRDRRCEVMAGKVAVRSFGAVCIPSWSRRDDPAATEMRVRHGRDDGQGSLRRQWIFLLGGGRKDDCCCGGSTGGILFRSLLQRTIGRKMAEHSGYIAVHMECHVGHPSRGQSILRNTIYHGSPLAVAWPNEVEIDMDSPVNPSNVCILETPPKSNDPGRTRHSRNQ